METEIVAARAMLGSGVGVGAGDDHTEGASEGAGTGTAVGLGSGTAVGELGALVGSCVLLRSAQHRTRYSSALALHVAPTPFVLPPYSAMKPPPLQLSALQTRFVLPLQPVPYASSLSNSAAVHRRPPLSSQKSRAPLQDDATLQTLAPLGNLLLPHTLVLP